MKAARYSKSGTIIALNQKILSNWDLKWVNNAYKGKRNSVNADLLKLGGKLLPESSRKKQRVLFPLCGQSVDMKYVSDQGHSVVGIEYSRVAILNFFRDQKIGYIKEQCEENEKFFTYRATGGNDITIYQGDIFDCDRASLGLFDVVWDKGSWDAIQPSDRRRYVNIMRQLVTKETQYCLNNVTLDQRQELNSETYSSTYEEIEDCFGNYFNIDRKYFYENELFKHIHNVNSYVTSVYMLTLREEPPKQRLDLATGRVTLED